MGQFVPMTAPRPQGRPAPTADGHDDRPSAWSRSGWLTYGEAERLLALDESTPWWGTAG